MDFFQELLLSFRVAYDHQINYSYSPEWKLIKNENCLLSFPLKRKKKKKKKKKKQKKEEEEVEEENGGGCSEGHYVYCIRGGKKKIYFTEGFQAILCQPSGRGRPETQQNKGKEEDNVMGTGPIVRCMQHGKEAGSLV